ncbi:GAF domain-containing sensor histidine kinase [Fulvivirga ligni]|uniref:GAF domain-containing sensor histidine kinase n=1 Tax=Fulvivirga ligni TaxID=2904246 RepID=UPI001F311363|nr:GAF domain-containing sensor histidine kinase [Fulvivirga ligni]UII24012.1 GAF domain-containing sensor histidine kinase [Fulvivirga ligni]
MNLDKERLRLETLRNYNILDTLSESDYDDITFLASAICGTPIALISFVDEHRQWFKSKRGLDAHETPRAHSFCSHAINHPNDIFIIEDSREDDRFKDNPLVTGKPDIVFYAGVPLVANNGHGLGTVCVIDTKVRQLTDDQKSALKMLSKNVMHLLELRQSNKELKLLKTHLEARNKDLENFAMVVSHDIKSPLTSILLSNELLADGHSKNLPEAANELINISNTSARKIKSMVEGILQYYQNENNVAEYHKIQLDQFFDNIKSIVTSEKGFVLDVRCPHKEIIFNRTQLEQIFLNLLNNSIRYNDKDPIVIEIRCFEDEEYYKFTLKDNGIGISKDDQAIIFDLFKTVSKKDRFGVKGSGIGLPTVRKIIENAGGYISIQSELGLGTTFTFTLEKRDA